MAKVLSVLAVCALVVFGVVQTVRYQRLKAQVAWLLAGTFPITHGNDKNRPAWNYDEKSVFGTTDCPKNPCKWTAPEDQMFQSTKKAVQTIDEQMREFDGPTPTDQFSRPAPVNPIWNGFEMRDDPWNGKANLNLPLDYSAPETQGFWCASKMPCDTNPKTPNFMMYAGISVF